MTRHSGPLLGLLVVAVAAAGCRRSSTDACDGVTCSSHGKCVVIRREPTCACYDGYRPDGPNCLPLRLPLAEAALPGPVPPSSPAGPPGVTIPPAPPEPAADATGEPPFGRLCSLVLQALVARQPDGQTDLATEAKRDAIGRYGSAIAEGCGAFLQEMGVAREAVACATRTLEQAAQEGLTLGALGARDPEAAACGEQWRQAIAAQVDRFQQMLQVQREQYGVAVFGFHRQYGFEGGAGEEFCRRFVAALPDAPPELLRPATQVPDDWAARVRSCGEMIDGYELPPLLRWCIVDRADRILVERSAVPCEPYAAAEEREGLRQLVTALLALAPVAAAAPSPDAESGR
jgi:hypothetical protein